jgi:hypothetical protein
LGGDYCGEGVGFFDYLMGCECVTDVFFLFLCVGRLQVVVVWLSRSLSRLAGVFWIGAMCCGPQTQWLILSGHTTQRSLGCGRRLEINVRRWWIRKSSTCNSKASFRHQTIDNEHEHDVGSVSDGH